MISTITVNFKTADYLEKMLASLFAFHTSDSVEVIVVENASGDDLTHLQSRFPSVKWVMSDLNLGFAGGCNLGAQQATGDYLCLLNPDIVFEDDALHQLEREMHAYPDVGIGGISLKNLDGTQQSCVWRFPTPMNQILVLSKIPHIFPQIGPVARWRMDDMDYSRSQDVDQIMGAFFCIRRDVFEQLHGLDQGFFMWYEEVDFCRRATRKGWRVRFFAGIHALHKKGSSFDRVRTWQKQQMIRRSLRRYMRKHFGWSAWILFIMLDPVFVVMSLLASLIKPL